MAEDERRSREVRLVSRPRGGPSPDSFRLVETVVGPPGPGQVLVRNLFLSVDPYMHARMSDDGGGLAPYPLDAPPTGGAVGEVVAGRTPELVTGDLVVHDLGWREYAVLDAGRVRPVDPWSDALPQDHLGALGQPGLAAYVGIRDIAQVRPGDVVFVSSAAGAVGSLAGQIARMCGAAQVIGSAGSAAKARQAEERFGYDKAFNYRERPVRMQLRAAAPDGIDVYFDNVGGDHLEAALLLLRPFGRVALCGAMSQLNPASAEGPRTLPLAISRRLTLRGFLVDDHQDRMPQFTRDMQAWLRAETVRTDTTVVVGIERVAEAFLGLLRGAHTGKTVVRLTD
ncbi:NADP-dependent oxidoreductase [Streptomyces sp. NPDC048441]|uniref:NADP-dependent oxidoreductase n=1 Tax=Streptomyces sp. NPDC048441 TaxID=3365552 RepID=UPI003710A9F4